jgi:ubiquitin-protein ligase
MMRLTADYERIRDEFIGHPYVTVEPASRQVPPERYVVTYRVPGLRWDSHEERPIRADLHTAEIYLHAEYPREKPKCVLKTPIWHPNFGNYICIGDHWAAGESLVDVIVQIGDMIQYRVYNPQSALNLAAGRWATEHRHLFPIGNLNVLQAEPDISFDATARRQKATDLDIFLGLTIRQDDLDITIR